MSAGEISLSPLHYCKRRRLDADAFLIENKCRCGTVPCQLRSNLTASLPYSLAHGGLRIDGDETPRTVDLAFTQSIWIAASRYDRRDRSMLCRADCSMRAPRTFSQIPPFLPRHAVYSPRPLPLESVPVCLQQQPSLLAFLHIDVDVKVRIFYLGWRDSAVLQHEFLVNTLKDVILRPSVRRGRIANIQFTLPSTGRRPS